MPSSDESAHDTLRLHHRESAWRAHRRRARCVRRRGEQQFHGTTTLDTGFVVSGSPESATGATWTYKGTSAGITYDLTGVLFKPAGAGPFPAVVLSHGHDGTAAFYASLIAPTMA